MKAQIQASEQLTTRNTRRDRCSGNGVSGLAATERWTTESLSFKYPDGNPVEIYWERPPSAWFQEEGISPLRSLH